MELLLIHIPLAIEPVIYCADEIQTERFHVGKESLWGLDTAQRNEILNIFPELNVQSMDDFEPDATILNSCEPVCIRDFVN